MTKIFVKMETGWCGEGATEVIDVDWTEEQLAKEDSSESIELHALTFQMAIENADRYGHEVDEDSEFEEDPYENVYATWEIYNPEEHDGYLMPGCIPEKD